MHPVKPVNPRDEPDRPFALSRNQGSQSSTAAKRGSSSNPPRESTRSRRASTDEQAMVFSCSSAPRGKRRAEGQGPDASLSGRAVDVAEELDHRVHQHEIVVTRHCGDLVRELPGGPEIVGIQEGHQFPSGCRNARVPRQGRTAAVVLQHNRPHPIVRPRHALDPRSCIVRRRIVHHQQFEAAVILIRARSGSSLR